MQRIITILLIVGVQCSLLAQAPKMVLVEEFTNASCIPCAAQNPAFNALLDTNRQHIIPLKYQTDFPGFDPMNRHIPDDIRNRFQAYGREYPSFNGVPTAFIAGDLPTQSFAGGIGGWGGNVYSGAPLGFNQAVVDYLSGDSASISIELSHQLYAQNDSIAISLKMVNHSSTTLIGDNRLYVILTEKNIEFPCGAPGTNGEFEFYDIAREFITGANGLQFFEIIAGDTLRRNYHRAIPEYIYNKQEVGVVAFLQSNADLSIYNAAVSYPDTLDYFADVTIRPRPGSISTLCDPEFVPGLFVKNTGRDSVHSVRLTYTLSGMSMLKDFNDLGLAPGETYEAVFDPINHPGGSIEAGFELETVNGRPGDGNSMNDALCYLFYAKKATDPYFEVLEQDFEDGPVGGEPIHYNTNTDRELVFNVVNGEFLNRVRGVGYLSDKGVIVNFYEWDTAQGRQTAEMALVHRLDLSNVQESGMRFKYYKASRLTDPSYGDTLFLQYSTDCGQNWQTFWKNGGESLQTTRFNYDRFEIPQFSSDWEEVEIPFDSVIQSQNNLMIQFVAINGGNNTLMIDDVEIIGEKVVSSTNRAIADDFKLWPNPVASGKLVHIRNTGESAIRQIKIYNAKGSLVKTISKLQNRQIEMPAYGGIYYLQLYTDRGVTGKRLMVIN